MKKAIIGILVFLAVLFIGDRLGAWAIKGLLSKSKFRYVELYNKQLPHENMVIGNSRGVHTFFTPHFKDEHNIAVKNMSNNGLPAQLMMIFLEDYIEKNQPENVVIEVTNLFYKKDRTNNTDQYIIYSDYSDRISKLLKEQSPKLYYSSQVFSLLKYNSGLLLRNLFYLNKKDDAWIMKAKISDGLKKQTEEMEPFNVELDKDLMDELKAFIKKAEQKNIRVQLFLAPYLPSYRAKMQGLENTLAEMEKQTGLKVYDCSLCLTDPNHFADRLHTNMDGAKALSDKLLEEKIILP